MKATLEFNLPEETYQHLVAVHALDWKHVVVEMDQYLRDQLKYGESNEHGDKALQGARDYLDALCRDNNINIYE